MEPLGNLRKYGELDVSQLRRCVEQQPAAAWLADDYRQQTFHVHKDTQTIHLLFDEDFRHFEPTRQPKYEEFGEALKPVMKFVSSHFEYQGWAVRCILTRLVSGGRINPHSDFGFSLAHAHRFHLPIITNDGVQFTVGDETVNMREGELWEINNRRRHSVVNGGSADRVHLILDWAEPITHADLRRYRVDRERHRSRAEAGINQRYD